MTARRNAAMPGEGCEAQGDGVGTGPFQRRRGGAAAWLVASLLGACGTSAPVRFHALSAITSPAPSRAAYDGPVIEVGAVQVPPAWTRPELVRDTGSSRFEVREFDQWAAPLPRLARQALAEDLEARLPAGKVVYPGATWPRAVALLEVDVLSFRVERGAANVVLSWSLRPLTAAVATRGAQLRLETPVADGDAETTAQTWNALLGQLADRIVADLSSR